ncbi:MAG: 3-phosphoserine/phosphohydroxythreonine transaminase [Caldimonas sp.]
MTRPFNFSPGPAALPEPVLRRAAEEMLDWHGSGVSVMEMSHRGKEFVSIYAAALAALRELLAIPRDYKILFLQGGAIGQNAVVPMNLLRGKTRADYVDTGDWSKRSITEAGRYCTVNVAASAEGNGFTAIPPQGEWRLDRDAAYVHICANETIVGLEYHWTPETGDVPLVADMSSNILSRPLDVARYGLIYAGAQKNIGPAGLTIVVVRDDLLGDALPITPTAFDYAVQAANDSMINTPPTYAIYIAGLVFDWLREEGGVAAMGERNRAKAALLYDALDASGFYRTRIAPADRSLMNVCFHLPDPALDAPFLAGARAAGLLNLKGHRIVGGMRASIYNAMPVAGARALVGYLREFEKRHG